MNPDTPFPLSCSELARHAIGLSDPNPRVGCVIADTHGQTLGTGHTQQAGGPHAEVVALRAAQAAGFEVRGATAYVTLEPCSHHGRTPPCCDALIAAGIARVVVALADPNPLVGGQGMARLRAAGIAVELLPTDHPAAVAARELNIGFLSRMVRGTPWVRLKVAGSLDGRTALPNGVSQWITSPEARTDGHAWRKRAGALLTGTGTVLEDDPRLDVRLVPTDRQPVRVVVDSRLDIAPTARILQAPGSVWVYTAADPAATATQRAALQALGATVIDCPSTTGKVDLAAMLRDLARREFNELHVEAGHKLNGSFLREGLVDELLLYLAPQLLGDGAGLAALGPFHALDQAPRFEFVDVERIGPDLRLRARPPGRAHF
ncbi:MAG: bifunctional diaminohydroxyphosphoribosylaminopyrimidine deaminase/5-amino-6-(5-phosphoribosylamino)uracil reductase RibD [Hydrogenophaga sp.]|nr:bifunctional diaminohydroxyphosphoribosylaminopyrimidine deaminase/5-amino-6-(5-phosphoribosylamino)uracil reductase RibD [Hydrogenophaga sp.]